MAETVHDVIIDVRNGKVELTAGDYAAGPEFLDPQAALEVAATLISAAREARKLPSSATDRLAAEYAAQHLDPPGWQAARVPETVRYLLEQRSTAAHLLDQPAPTGGVVRYEVENEL